MDAQNRPRCGRPSKAKTSPGKVFGMLTVSSFSHMSEDGKNSFLHCLCACGNSVVVSWCYLQQSKNPNCGCTPWRPVHRYVTEEHRKAKDAKWRSENIAKVRAKQKEWRDQNRARLLREKMLWKARNPAKVKAARVKFAKAHPERVAAGKAKRRAIKRGATVIGDTKVIARWERSWRSKRRVTCFWCRGSFSPKVCQTDHIDPLKLTGPHSISNLCISCASCNSRKNAKTVSAWNASLAQPVLL